MVRFGSPPPSAKAVAVSFESPLNELNHLIDELEFGIADVRKQRVQALLAPHPSTLSSPSAGIRRLFSRRPIKGLNPDTLPKYNESEHPNPQASNTPNHRTSEPIAAASVPTSPNYNTSLSRSYKETTISDTAAQFVPLDCESFVEHLRRVAELVVTGENYTSSRERKEHAKQERFRDKWKSRDVLEDLETTLDEDDAADEADRQDPHREEYGQLFDLFFERDVLNLIISLLTGAAFILTPDEEAKRRMMREKTTKDTNVDSVSSKGRTRYKLDDTVATSGATDTAPNADDSVVLTNGDVTCDLNGDDEQRPDLNDDAMPLHATVVLPSSCTTDDDHQPSPGDITEEGAEIAGPASRRIAMDVQGVPPRPSDDPLLLPPIEVAQQALQSVSILIQNVSRATSLFIILSNNRINELINMPLDAYASALCHESGADVSSETNQELSELTTHFVSFLKSLALRMNAETLQFFLKYPDEMATGDGVNTRSSSCGEASAVNQAMKVEFPLYGRALEFCSADQESFVRTTALNICLNTLRLASVASLDGECHIDGADLNAKSPSGVLHDNKPLPFRERLSIALFACIPSRVELLVSPICTKLAEKWASLDEHVREIDLHSHETTLVPSNAFVTSTNDVMERAHETARRLKFVRAVKDKAADLLDELHLLEDVFSVGLTVLNEQLIEMLLATFVYPLLLQPLRLCSQRLSAELQSHQAPTLDINPLNGCAGDYSAVSRALTQVSGPAKTAMISLASMFYIVTNKPFAKLVYAALLHPVAPNTSALPTLRTKLGVEWLVDGKRMIRLDTQAIGEANGRSTYAFGRDNSRSNKDGDDPIVSHESGETGEACIFVLAPALADVLESSGADDKLVALSETNPYRQALVSFLALPNEFADVRDLASCAIDAALGAMDGDFAGDILYGADLFESVTQGHSGMSSGLFKGKLTSDIIVGLCRSTITAYKCCRSAMEWKLEYNDVAAHALLRAWASGRNPFACAAAKVALEELEKQAATFVASYSFGTASPMGGSDFNIVGAPSINDPTYDEQISAFKTDLVLYDMSDSSDTPAIASQFLQLSGDGLRGDDHYLAISRTSDLDFVCERVGFHFIEAVKAACPPLSDMEEIQMARASTSVVLRGDALLYYLTSLVSPKFDKALLPPGMAASSRDEFAALDDRTNKSPQQIHSPISAAMKDVLFECTAASSPELGATISLHGFLYVACVCEVAAAYAGLFAAGETGVVAEGVTWQSLYLAVADGFLVVVQPTPAEAGSAQGVVVSTCRLDRLSVHADEIPPENGSTARRLILSHAWYDKIPPLLFLFDVMPDDESHDGYIRRKAFTSTLDVWFEDETATEHALNMLSRQIFVSKSTRGRRVMEFLANK